MMLLTEVSELLIKINWCILQHPVQDDTLRQRLSGYVILSTVTSKSYLLCPQQSSSS